MAVLVRPSHGDLWIGDVGQDKYEEIDYARAGLEGINWGWNLREGFHPYNGGAGRAGAHDPILERPHAAGDCAIIGGYVYRGTQIPALVGAYVFGDDCTGVLRAIDQNGGRVDAERGPASERAQLTTFGQGPKGAHLRRFVPQRHDLHDRGCRSSLGRARPRQNRPTGRGA